MSSSWPTTTSALTVMPELIWEREVRRVLLGVLVDLLVRLWLVVRKELV